MKPSEGGSVEICRLKVPFATLRDMRDGDWVNDALCDQVTLAENGIFSVKF